MKIYIDADACPQVIREILLRASERTQTPLYFVANHQIPLPKRDLVHFTQVQKGFDVADNVIAQQAEVGDIVVTQDIPLAADVVEKGVKAINPRGELYTAANIRARLSMRNFMEDLRNSGVQTGGPKAFGAQEKQAFANTLDRLLVAKTKR